MNLLEDLEFYSLIKKMNLDKALISKEVAVPDIQYILQKIGL